VYHLAQVNIGRMRAPLDDLLMAEFVSRLDEINAIADASPGFVWRLQSAEGNATSVRAYDDPHLLINMSVWESLDALSAYVYASAHRGVMRRRREWFARMETFLCLWWVPAGHRPPVAEAEERLVHLRAHGPSQHAFTFRALFPQPGLPPVAVRDDRDLCPA
jgi:heme-degrading monooxygenase HmoA